MKKPIGVLFMAYGGPDSLDDIPGYLADIRAGRTTSAALIDEITRNYRLIGGASPLLALTRDTVDGVMEQLSASDNDYTAYLGMRHWAPWIEDTVGCMLDDGIERAVSLVLAPHYSSMSIAKYQKKIAAGLEYYHGHIEFAHIEQYHDAPGLIEALSERVRMGIERFPEEKRDTVHVVFSAHSLPVRILKSGDPYDRQCRETAALVAMQANLPADRWSWCYQSEGRSPEPWLGPQLEDYLVDLAKAGIRNVVSLPVGFVSDHVEVLYDIDIEAQAVAQAHDMRLERPPSLNSDPVFVRTLAELIEGAVRASDWV